MAKFCPIILCESPIIVVVSRKIAIFASGYKVLSTMKISPPKFIRNIFPELIWQIEDEQGVYLTFDDGPTPGITEWILETLKQGDILCVG